MTSLAVAAVAMAAAAAAATSPGDTSTSSSTISTSSQGITIGVSVNGAGHALSVSNFSFFGAGANTTNLPPDLSFDATQVGGTYVVLAGGPGTPITPTCVPPSCTVTVGGGGGGGGSSTLVVSGVTLGSLASETWTFSSLNSTALSWTVQRTYAEAAALLVDRVALTLLSTGGLPIHSQQIPSFVDLDIFFNETSTGGFVLGNGAYEYLSARTRQFVRFSPTGAVFLIEASSDAQTPLFWSFAKPFADGTTWTSSGFETVDPRGAPRTVAPGQTETVTVVYSLLATDAPTPAGLGDPFPRMDVSLPNATLQEQVEVLAAVQYQLLGYIFGNNPASSPCLHEMAWWPLLISVFSSDSLAVAAMQKELSFFGAQGWQPGVWAGDYAWTHTGNLTLGAEFGMTQRYSSEGFYSCPWGPLQDQNVMLPIAVYYTAAVGGDLAWLATMRPALDAMAAYLASRGLGNGSDPVLFTSPASGIADGGRHASNWFDIVEFGHQDAFLAVHGVWAVGCLAEIYAALGDADEAARFEALHVRAVADFNAVFWDASNSSYIDWIDIENTPRHYFYTDIAFLAIIAGVADANQTASLLGHYETRLQAISVDYNTPLSNIFSPPCSLYPITNEKEFATQRPIAFPMYESGGSFFHTAGFSTAAYGVAGRADDAVTGFINLLSSGFFETRAWAQQLYWGPTNQLVGFDPLNTALVGVWGLFRAAFGVTPTLNDGIRVVNAPAASFEGARWNVSSLGQSVCVQVLGGKAVFCGNGTAVPGV
jgi:hypothetical protein